MPFGGGYPGPLTVVACAAGDDGRASAGAASPATATATAAAAAPASRNRLRLRHLGVFIVASPFPSFAGGPADPGVNSQGGAAARRPFHLAIRAVRAGWCSLLNGSV